jgi:hypothetical protein
MRRATKEFLRQLTPKQILKENGLNKFRLRWRGLLCVMAGSLLFCFLFDYFGHFELARPVMFSTAIISIAVAFRWQLRHHLWFWVVVAITAALHVLGIANWSWTTRWVPAAVSAGYMTIDLYVILVVISVVRKFEGDEPDSGQAEPVLRAHRKNSDQRA